MKQKHLFICDDDVHENMVVYIIMVGTSQREKKRAEKVQACAARFPDVFFKKWSCEICDFYSRLAEQVYPLMAPRDAVQKFHLRNTRYTSLNDVVKSLLPCCDSNVIPTQAT